MVGGVTLSEYGVSWLRRRTAQGKTDEGSRWTTHIASDPIGSKAIAGIHPADVRAWIDRTGRKRVAKGNGHSKQAERKISRQTWQNALNLLRACLELAFDDGLIKCNPARGLSLPQRPSDLKARTQEVWTWLDLEEQATLIHGCKEPERWIVQFALWTGLRWGEQASLRSADVHADSPSPHVVVRYGTAEGPTKGRRIRYVPLLPGALEAWEQWNKAMSSRLSATGLAFPSWVADAPRGRPPRCFDAVVEACGISGQTGHAVVWHSLRHSCASMLVSGAWGACWSLEEVKGMLGHKSIATTERYAHLAQSALARAADRLRTAMGQPTAKVVEMKASAK